MKHLLHSAIAVLFIHTTIAGSVVKATLFSTRAMPKQLSTDLIKVPLSVGDLVDKITILEIKIQRISGDPQKMDHVLYEWHQLITTLEKNVAITPALEQLKLELFHTNEKLWDIEDATRIKESKKEFDTKFIELARNVYYTNDHRSALRRKINQLTGSVIVDEKQYARY